MAVKAQVFVQSWYLHLSGKILFQKFSFNSKQPNGTKNVILRTEWPGWPDNYLIFGHLKQWKFAQKQKAFAKVSSKFCQILNKLSKFCQISLIFAKMAIFRQIWSHWREASSSWCSESPRPTSQCQIRIRTKQELTSKWFFTLDALKTKNTRKNVFSFSEAVKFQIFRDSTPIPGFRDAFLKIF